MKRAATLRKRVSLLRKWGRNAPTSHSDLRPLPYLILAPKCDRLQRFPQDSPFRAARSIPHTGWNYPLNYPTAIDGSIRRSPENCSTDDPNITPQSSQDWYRFFLLENAENSSRATSVLFSGIILRTDLRSEADCTVDSPWEQSKSRAADYLWDCLWDFSVARFRDWRTFQFCNRPSLEDVGRCTDGSFGSRRGPASGFYA